MYDELDLTDDEWADIEAANRDRHERMVAERKAAEEADAQRTVLIGKITGWLHTIGFPHARVKILPKGSTFVPGFSNRRPDPDIEWQPHEMRFWDGFKPACDLDRESLRGAGREIVTEFGSFPAALELCAAETRGRWARVTAGYSDSSDDRHERWAWLLARGLTAIKSEARYRLKIRG